jgi:Domain of unknown function (DUF4384)
MEKKMNHQSRSLISLCSLFFLFASLFGQQSPKTGAKDLFYDPATGEIVKPDKKQPTSQKTSTPSTPTQIHKIKIVPSEQAKFVGIHYWVELDGLGPVTDNRTFYTGDRIKIHVRSNVDGYLSLWSLTPSGRAQMLFPQNSQGADDSFVKAGLDYAPTGFIKFSPPAEPERLMVFFSKSKADFPSPTNHSMNAEVIAKAVPPSGSKALVFETETNTSGEIGSYVVNKMGGPVGREITLKHATRVKDNN